jgi:hypothetical protein
MRRPLLAALLAAAMVVGMGASVAFAGEVTGNGKNLWTSTIVGDEGVSHTLHGKSFCAFSGQEDAQFYDEFTGEPLAEGEVVKGVPAHAQSWGQIPKEFRDFLTSIGEHPGTACNPTKVQAHP